MPISHCPCRRRSVGPLPSCYFEQAIVGLGKWSVNYTARKVHIAVELSFGFSAGLEDVMQVCESVQTLMPTDAKRHQIHPT